MDLALRTLREGRAAGEGPAPLLVLRDDLAVVGGPALLRQASCRASWGCRGSKGILLCEHAGDQLAECKSRKVTG
jgi:hypothetical protein